MKSIVALLFAFLCIGIIARKIDKKINILLMLAAISLVVYATIK
jgi:hypothetical protein